jgi:hypothetical protein
VVARPGFSGHGVAIRGGFAFGHSPSFGVVIGPRHVFRRPVFRPFFSVGFGYPYYPYAYAYPPYYYDSFYYSDYAYAPPTPPPAAYYSDDRPGLAEEVYRLRGEVAQLREEQARDQQERAAAAPVPRPPAARSAEAAPPSIVLVFRDGHRSEVRNYAIVGPTLWMFSEEQAKKVPLSSLDVEATTKANEQRGIEFRLPTNAQPAH